MPLLGLSTTLMSTTSMSTTSTSTPVTSTLATSTTSTSSAPNTSCLSTYTSVAGDTCHKLNKKYNLVSGTIKQANLSLDCRDIWTWMPICVPDSPYNHPTCKLTYTSIMGDTCSSINANSQLLLFKFNKLQQQGKLPTPGSVLPRHLHFHPHQLWDRGPLALHSRHNTGTVPCSILAGSLIPPVYHPTGSFNPFNTSAMLRYNTITCCSSILHTNAPTETNILHHPQAIIHTHSVAKLTQPVLFGSLLPFSYLPLPLLLIATSTSLLLLLLSSLYTLFSLSSCHPQYSQSLVSSVFTHYSQIWCPCLINKHEGAMTIIMVNFLCKYFIYLHLILWPNLSCLGWWPLLIAEILECNIKLWSTLGP